MGDNLGCADKVAAAKQLVDLGCGYIVHHTGYDERRGIAASGVAPPTPLDELKAVVEAVDVPVQAVGGLSIEQAVRTPEYGAPLVVIGAPLAIDADAFRTADGDLEASLRLICEAVHNYGEVGPDNADERRIGKAIFEAADCQSCHIVGELGDGPVPDAIKAPNLLMGQERLRPEWLSLWLADPGALSKNTAMPSFWGGGNQMEMYLQTNPEFQAAIQGVAPDMIKQYAASPQLQIQATRNYLFRLDR